MEYQRIERELEHLKRQYIAAQYVKAVENSEAAESNVIRVKNQIEQLKSEILKGEEETENIDKKIKKITEKRDAVIHVHMSNPFLSSSNHAMVFFFKYRKWVAKSRPWSNK